MRPLALARYVSARDVVLSLGCSRSTAYEHLRRAARRPPGARGLLRVPVLVWERYVSEVICRGSPVAVESGTATSTMEASASSARRDVPIAVLRRCSSGSLLWQINETRGYVYHGRISVGATVNDWRVVATALAGAVTACALRHYANHGAKWVLPVPRFCDGDVWDLEAAGWTGVDVALDVARAVAAGSVDDLLAERMAARPDLAHVWPRYWAAMPTECPTYRARTRLT